MASTGLLYLGVAAAMVLVVGGTALVYLAPASAPPPAGVRPGSVETGSLDGLLLGARANATAISAGQTLSLEIWELNPGSAPVNVSAASRWPYQGLSLGPCGTLAYPFGFKVLSGYYDESSPGLASAPALQLYAPGPYACPAIFSLGSASYYFHPGSTDAAVGGFCSPGPCLTLGMNETSAFGGEYAVLAAARTPFPPGSYTVVVGDEWGASLLLHFAVAGHASPGTVLLPTGTRLAVSSSYDCVAGHYDVAFATEDRAELAGGFAATGPGVALYVATPQQALGLAQGHPSSYMYATGLTNGTTFSTVLPAGSYVLWIEGADLNCGAEVSMPLETLTSVNVTQAFLLTPA